MKWIQWLWAFLVFSQCFGANYAFVAMQGAQDGLMIIDVTNPLSPVIVANQSLFGFPLAVAITPSGDYATVTSPSLEVINIMDPTSPSLVGSLNFGTSMSKSVAITSDGAYALAVSSFGGLHHNRVSLMNITDPSTPTLTSVVTVGINPQCVAITPDGDYAVISNFNLTLSFINITDRNSPEIIATLDLMPSLPAGVAITPDGFYAYVVTTDYKMFVIDITNRNIPVIVNTTEFSNVPLNIAITSDGQYAVVTNSTSNSISIVNIEDPTDPIVTSTLDVGERPYAVAIDPYRNYAYVTNNLSENIYIVDFTDPYLPEVVNIFNLDAGIVPEGIALYFTSPPFTELKLYSEIYRSLFQKIIVNSLLWSAPSLSFVPVYYLISRSSESGEIENFNVPISKIGVVNGSFEYKDSYQTRRNTNYSYVVTALGSLGQTQEIAIGSITTP